MNSISRSLRGIIILVVAIAIGVVVLSKTVETGTASDTSVPTESLVPTTVFVPVTTVVFRDPKTVTVLVANGSKVNGAAKRARNCLISDFDVKTPVDVNKPKPLPTAIYADAGYENEAARVATLLGADLAAVPKPVSLPVTDTQAAGINIIVVVGTELANSVKNLPCAEAPSAGVGTSTTIAAG
jgi:hypothetical protein